MSDSVNSLAVYLLPGMKIKIKAPDYFVKLGTQLHQKSDGKYKKLDLEHGYLVEDKDIGDITKVEGEPAVIYEHKKYMPNKIWFYARTGERAVVDVISVPIHDHSSIVTGGPAYGTYFTDDETLDTEE